MVDIAKVTGSLSEAFRAWILDVEVEEVLGLERICKGERLYLCPESKSLYFCDMSVMR
jgi:hypothetical protein